VTVNDQDPYSVNNIDKDPEETAEWQESLDALVAVLHPDVVMREDYSDRRPLRMFRGSAAVASRGGAGSGPEVEMLPALINGAAGAVIVLRGRPFAVVGFIVDAGRIVRIDAILGAERVRRIAAAVLG